MLDAVSVVQSYLRVNGFFTVTEYPIIHRRKEGHFQEVTDVDVLAVRMPEAGRVLPRPSLEDDDKMPNDAALGLRWGRGELVIAEVKEGTARVNQAMFRRPVVREALRRFGACPRKALGRTVDELMRKGTAVLDDGTRVRLLVFASRPPSHPIPVPFLFMSLGDVLEYLRAYIRSHWAIQNTVPFRDPVLRFLAMLEKGDEGTSIE